MKPTNALPAEKLATIGQLRSRLRMGVRDGKVMINVFLDMHGDQLVAEQSRDFRYEPEYVDAVFLEFLGTSESLLRVEFSGCDARRTPVRLRFSPDTAAARDRFSRRPSVYRTLSPCKP